MKRILFTLVVLITLVGCSNKKDNASLSNQQINTVDTAGLAEYQAWRQQKDQLQPIDMNALEGVVAEPQKSNLVTTDQKPGMVTKIIYRDRISKRQNKTTVPEVTDEPYSYPKPQGPTRESVSRKDAPVGDANGSGEGSSTGGTGDGNVVVQPPSETPAKKEGWSKAAKGAAIGAAGGAVVGAVISKNKGLGAVIGGVAGGLGGYAIGRSKDKKDGRYFVEN